MSTFDLGAVKEEQQVAILRYLLKHGARPVVSDENQLTPLMLAGICGFKYTQSQIPHWRKLAMSSLAIYLSCDSFSRSANLCPVALG